MLQSYRPDPPPNAALPAAARPARSHPRCGRSVPCWLPSRSSAPRRPPGPTTAPRRPPGRARHRPLHRRPAQAGRDHPRPAGRRRHPGPPAHPRPRRPHPDRRRGRRRTSSRPTRTSGRSWSSGCWRPPAFVRPPGGAVRRHADRPGRQRPRRGSVRDYLAAALDGRRLGPRLPRPDAAGRGRPEAEGGRRVPRGRVNDLDRLTNDVSVPFFGVNISCAQCHDHPLVADWKQDHFYGMKSFFARTYEAGGVPRRAAAGLVKFKPTKGPERPAKLMFLTGADGRDRHGPRADQGRAEEGEGAGRQGEQGEEGRRRPPAFSARAELVELALRPGERTSSPGRSSTACGTGSSGTGW